MLVNFAKQFKVTPLRYQLIENDPSEFKRYKLDKHLAQKLFFKEGKLNGSISSFEGYNNCNYSYFLKKWIKTLSQTNARVIIWLHWKYNS